MVMARSFARNSPDIEFKLVWLTVHTWLTENDK